MGQAVEVLRGKCSGQTAESVRRALEFWDLLGFVLVHGDWLIPRPTDMIDLVRPLVHHDPLAALDKTLSRGASTSWDQEASADWVVPGFAELDKGGQAQVRAMVRRLIHDRVLCEELQPHLRGWKDASAAERDALCGVLERFGLIVVHDVGGQVDKAGGEREWLCTCRMDSRPGPDKWDEAQWKAFVGKDTPMVPVVRYTFDHVPSALFPHIVASQMSNRDYKAEHRRKQNLKGGLLSVQLQATAERHDFFQVALTTGERRPGGGATVQIVVVSSSVGLMRSLCASVEKVMSWRFPGLSHDVEGHLSAPDGACVWKVDADMTLGGVLARKDWDRPVMVELGTAREPLNLKLREIFHAVPGIFISHSWLDQSVTVSESERERERESEQERERERERARRGRLRDPRTFLIDSTPP